MTSQTPPARFGGDRSCSKAIYFLLSDSDISVLHHRKLSKNRGSFPSDEALVKLFYLALRNISQKWSMPIRDWKAALTRFTIAFGDRISIN